MASRQHTLGVHILRVRVGRPETRGVLARTQHMDIRELLNDDDAVSPVIGVILMVAITVILAAVIASFVLGLGDQAQNTTPQASITFDYDGSVGGTDEGILTASHDGGDSIQANELYVRGTVDTSSSSSISNDGWSNFGSETGTTDVTAGSSGTVDSSNAGDVTDNYDIRVVYESEEGDNSATLSQSTGPDA